MKKYVTPKIEFIFLPLEEGIAQSSVRTGGNDSNPVIEDWIDESDTQSHFFDN